MCIRRTDAIITTTLMVAGLLLWLPQIRVGAEPGDTKSRDESAETTRLIAAELPNWKFWKGVDRASELELEPKSVLRWTNPGTGRVYGDLYLWTANGRPEVAMSLFKAWEPANGFHVELHSLSLLPLEAERNRKVVWQPRKAGVDLRNVPDAAAPADTPIRRLTQMRALANEFSVNLTDYRQNKAGEKQALRLLPQPIYRYRSVDTDLIDGAMFVFVLGTDPEVFLLLEGHRLKEVTNWQFGLARMNDSPLIVMHKQEEVWRVDRASSRDDLRDPYVLMRVPETP